MAERFTDKDLGEVVVIRNVRARNVIARRKADSIQLTVPVHYSMNQIFEVFEQLKPRLSKLSVKPVFVFSPDSVFTTHSFTLDIQRQAVKNYYMSLKAGVLSIACPENTDFEDQSVQTVIRDCIEKAMRYEAKRIFPDKLKSLAQQYNFNYTDVKINKSRTRWGSCSSKKSINLSYFCMLLPDHLIDFIILHELCHTREMNHGVNFWKHLDSVTDSKAKELTQELKSFAISW